MENIKTKSSSVLFKIFFAISILAVAGNTLSFLGNLFGCGWGSCDYEMLKLMSWGGFFFLIFLFLYALKIIEKIPLLVSIILLLILTAINSAPLYIMFM